MKDITVLITIFRKGRKAIRLSKLSPVLSICVSNPILALRITYRAVFLVLQTSHSDELTVDVSVIAKLLHGYILIW